MQHGTGAVELISHQLCPQSGTLTGTLNLRAAFPLDERSHATIRGMDCESYILLLGLYILDKQARLQYVIVRLADVRLINSLEPVN